MKPWIYLSLCAALACHPAVEPFGRVVERGGELGDVGEHEKKTVVTPREISVWGVLEVPEGSRMQAAYAGVDAVVRAELLKLIRVRVASVMVSVDSTDPAQRDAYEHTVEVAGGVIRNAGIPRHGWERVRHPDKVILRVWANLIVPRAELQSALQNSTDLPLPADMLDALNAP